MRGLRRNYYLYNIIVGHVYYVILKELKNAIYWDSVIVIEMPHGNVISIALFKRLKVVVHRP